MKVQKSSDCRSPSFFYCRLRILINLIRIDVRAAGVPRHRAQSIVCA